MIMFYSFFCVLFSIFHVLVLIGYPSYCPTPLQSAAHRYFYKTFSRCDVSGAPFWELDDHWSSTLSTTKKNISTIFGLNACVCDSGFEVMFVLLPHPTICSILCIDPLTWSSALSRPWPAGVWPSTHQRPWPAGFWPSAPSHDLDLLVFVWPSALPRPWSADVRSRGHSRPWPVDVWSSVLP